MVTTVRENHAVSKIGAPVTYRDVHFSDTNPDPLTRLQGEVVWRPNDGEFLQSPCKRGDLFDLSVVQCLEMRNGNLVARVDLQPVKK